MTFYNFDDNLPMELIRKRVRRNARYTYVELCAYSARHLWG
jgi:hypothetical protein